MFQSALPLGLLTLVGISSVHAQSSAPSCSLTQKCPEATPCCSQYGQCGVGAYCLGGCDPRMSFSLDSCVPEPVCKSKTYSMNSLDGIVDVSKYLGDSSKADWVAQGTPLAYKDSLLLTMPPRTAGTVLASTTYMWYGNVKAKVKTSRGAGVVTAFILLSDVKDEIDFEWVGTELDIAQTNYYFQGIPNYTQSYNITGLSNTYDNFHEYEIQWTPDTITWLVDGKVGRTKKRSDTWNSTSNQWDYPQTPARVQISIWPGGDEKNAKGTVDWAGGPIDWNSDDIQKNKYYYATFGEITIDCYQTKSAPGTNSGKSYYFNDMKALNTSVVDSDKNTVLKSLLGTGKDMDKDIPRASGSATQSSQEVIPGLSGGGPGTNGQAAGEANSGGSGSGSGSSGSTATSGSSQCVATGFSQSCNGNSGSGSGSSGSTSEGIRPERMMGASAFAALVAVGAMLWI